MHPHPALSTLHPHAPYPLNPKPCMELHIKDQYGSVAAISCSPSESVEALKARYCAAVGDDPRGVELFWQRRYLVPTATLAGAKLADGDQLFANRYQVGT